MMYSRLFLCKRGGSSGAGSHGGGGSAASATPVDAVRGVPQSQIDQLRGTRDHLDYHELTSKVIQDDYARVGITISSAEAQKIRQAITRYTGDSYIDMRKAYSLERAGRTHDLSSYQKGLLADYKMCMEYCKVAPTYQPSKNQTFVHRGIKNDGSAYAKKMMSLKVGDTWNVDGMPTSFTTRLQTAKNFADNGLNKGLVVHLPIKNLKNSPSIRGASVFEHEFEVFVADYSGWKVSKVTNEDGAKNIYFDYAD